MLIQAPHESDYREVAKGILQDPGRVPSSKVDRQKGAEERGDGEAQEYSGSKT